MKKIYTLAFALLILLSTGSVWAYDISPQDVTGSPGSSVSVPIKINNSGSSMSMDAFGFTLTYDDELVTFDEIDKSGTLAQSFSLVAGREITPGQVKINGALFGSSVTVNSEGVFLKVKFNIKSTASRDAAISLSDFKDDVQAASSISGKIIVQPLGAYTLSPEDKSAKADESVQIPVNISNVGGGMDMDAFGFTFSFDPDVLEFVGVEKAGTLTHSFSLVAGQVTEAGKAKINGALFGSSVRIGASGLFLKVNFTVKADAGENSVLSLSDFKDDIANATTSDAMFTLPPLPPSTDTDDDGMLDAWEMEHFGTLDRDGSGDYDTDGHSDKWEHDHGTNPNDSTDPTSDTSGDNPDLGDKEGACNGDTISVPLSVESPAEGIEGIDVKIEFSSSVLVAMDATLTGGILDGRDYSLTYQIEDGEITVSISSNGNLVAEDGIVAYLNFYVTGDEGSVANLTFAKARVNEKNMETNGGSVKVECPGLPMLSGKIRYFNGDAPVSDVLVELDGVDYYSTATENDGEFEFQNFTHGNYSLTPSKNNHFGGLSGTDASRIAKQTVGLMSFDCYQKIAADVDMDGQITATDASRVARYAAGKISYLNASDLQWVFVPSDTLASCDGWPPIAYASERTYAPLDQGKSDQDFIAVRLGDVSGNWTDEPIRTRKRVAHSVCDVKAVPGDTLTFPVVLKADMAIEGLDIKVEFDESVFELTGATLSGGVLENEAYALLTNTDNDGEAVIVLSSNGEVFSGTGEVVFLTFDVIGKYGDEAPLSLTKFEVNEMPTPGGFEVNGKVCENVRLGN